MTPPIARAGCGCSSGRRRSSSARPQPAQQVHVPGRVEGLRRALAVGQAEPVQFHAWTGESRPSVRPRQSAASRRRGEAVDRVDLPAAGRTADAHDRAAPLPADERYDHVQGFGWSTSGCLMSSPLLEAGR